MRPRARSGHAVLLAALLLGGCAERPLGPCPHPVPDGGFDLASRTTMLPPVCRRIFVIDGGRATRPASLLSAFDPETLTFEDLGVLRCPSSSSPFSMAVARDNTALVLFGDGNIFRVDLDTLACSATGFQPNQQGFTTFGMGFVADAPGADAETLFIASGPNQAAGAPGFLGTIDVTTLRVRPLGRLPMMDSPELTGTGQGELWGFTPNIAVPLVARIDKRNAAYSNAFQLPQLRSTSGPQAWAFAFWGGTFYLFLQRSSDQDSSTRVTRLDRVSGDVQIGQPTGREIVGAGVSSCAPVGLDL